MARLSVRERDHLHAVERLCGLDHGSRTLRREIVRRIGRLVAHDASCFATMDPLTLLFTDAVSDGIPSGSVAVATHNEYLVDDVDKFAELARSGRGTGILTHSTGGDPQRSHRYRTVLPLIDATDELRVVFVVDKHCWGALSLFRGRAAPGFTSREALLLQAVSRPIAAALRRVAIRPTAVSLPGTDPEGPGVLLLGQDNRVLAANVAARHHLDELSPERMAVHEVASATRAGLGSKSFVRVRSTTGRWLSIWGSSTDGDVGGVSVVIQPAPTSDVVRMLTLAHGLTSREEQVLQLVISGTDSAGIAARLQVSPHTVASHVKSLFGKFGVRSRGELVSELIADPYGR